MLLLLFYLGDDRYALDSKRVVEVVPLVALKKLHHAPDYLAGLFNYRGRIVPAIDLCHLIRGHSCRPHLSTRIILVNYLDRQQNPYILGLMAERVTDTVNKSETEFIDSGLNTDAALYLGKMFGDEQGMVQCIRVEHLLSESQRTYLLPS